jgi:hypothetical protein
LRDNATDSAKASAKAPSRPEVPGILILDPTETKKIVQALEVALSAGRRPSGFMSDTRKPVYRSIILICPQNLIRQWAREILFEWPICDLLISYDDGAMEPFLADHVVSSSAVRAWPDSKLWPKEYAFIFNMLDERNSRLIVLSTPETNAERTLVKEKIVHPAISFDLPKFKKNGDEILKLKVSIEIKYHSKWKGVYSVATVEEATKIKSTNSIRHLGVQRLEARRWIF